MVKRTFLVLCLAVFAGCGSGADTNESSGDLGGFNTDRPDPGFEIRDGGGAADSDPDSAPGWKSSAGPNNCCQVHAAPLCSDSAINDMVCPVYQHCCNSTWDMMCVMFVEQMGKCSAGPVCGDASCQAPDESCSSCPQDCGCPAPKVCFNNSCCLPSCVGKACGDDGCGGSCGLCNDNNACTIDPCIVGVCQYIPRNCYDSNPCTVDGCNPQTGCTYTVIAETCNGADDDCDGKTDEDVVCDDGNPCTIDSCTGGACVFSARPIGSACSDGNPCTTGDACRLGPGKTAVCAGLPKSCQQPQNPCVQSLCNPATGFCETSTGCDDRNPCTTDKCGPTGCVFSPVPAGTACDDGNGCTVGDACQDSVCRPGTGSWCQAADGCHQLQCVSSKGSASCLYPARADGTQCDDRNACTAVDTCQGGVCVGSGAVPDCTADTFDLGWPIGDVVFEPIPQNSCRRGTKTIDPCDGLPFCQVTATACPGAAGSFTTVNIEATVDFGPLGVRNIIGPWVAEKWCMYADIERERFGDLVPEIGGTPTVSVCLELGEVRRHTTIPEWRPFPWDPQRDIGPVVGNVLDESTPVRFRKGLGDYAPLAAAGGPDKEVTISKTWFDAYMVQGTAGWQKSLGGTLAIRISEGESPDYEGPVAGVINTDSAGGPSLKALVEFLEVWPSSFPGFGIDDAEITVFFDVLEKHIHLGLAGRVRTPFPGTDKTFDFQVQAGGQDWNSPELWISGSGRLLNQDGLEEPLDAPGLQPAEGPLCIVISNADLPAVTACGKEVAEGLQAFFTARALQLLPDPPMIDAALSIKTLPPAADEIRFAGQAPEAVELITPAMEFPGVKRLKLLSLQYSSTYLAATNTNIMELTGPAELLPSETDAEAIEARFTLRITSMALGLTSTDRLEQFLELRGRWTEPLGLPDIALDDATLLVPPLSATFTKLHCAAGVLCPMLGDIFGMNENLPATTLGFDGTAYRKQGGDWPPEPPVSDERCNDPAAEDEDGDGKANCEDPDCTDHLACAAKATGSNIHTVGVTFFSRQPVMGYTGNQSPALVLRLDYGPEAFASLDLDAALGDAYDKLVVMAPGLASILGGLAGMGLGGPLGMLLGSAMGAFLAGEVADLFPAPETLPFSLGILDMKLEGLSVRFATDNMDLWNERYQAGLSARIDGSLGLKSREGGQVALPGQAFHLDGAMDVGFGMRYAGTVMLPELVLQKLTLIPLVTEDNIVPDPFAHSLRFKNPGGQTLVRVPHDPGLDPASGTMEGWIRGGPWGKGETSSVLAEKISTSGKTANGYSIGIGKRDLETGYARVSVKFLRGYKVRLLQTGPVVPPDKLVHLAVTWGADEDSGDTLVAVYVDGLRQELSDTHPPLQTPPAAFGPGASSAALTLARNLQEVDDLRVWKRVREAGEIVGEAFFLDSAYTADPDLLLRFEFDFDQASDATIHNTRYLDQAQKRHGTAVGEFELPGAATGLARLQLVVPDDPTSKLGGLWIRAGFRLPWDNGGISLRADLQLADGEARGTFISGPVELLAMKNVGRFFLSSDGPIKAPDATFDDLLFGKIDVVKHEVTASGNLFYETPGGGHRILLGQADSTYSSAEDIFSDVKDRVSEVQTGAMQTAATLLLNKSGQAAAAALELKADAITITNKVEGGVTSAWATIKGRLSFLGRSFSNDAFKLLPDKLSFSDTEDVDLLGVKFGSARLDLTFDFGAWTLCGKGTGVASGLTCDLNLCFGPNGGTTGTARCGGNPVCTKNSDCPDNRICLGIVCTEKLGWHNPCIEDSHCATGLCDVVCYSRNSQDIGDDCFYLLDDECKKGLTCAGGVCTPFRQHGEECNETGECPGETVCRYPAARGVWGAFGALITNDTQCLYEAGSRPIGASCRKWDECVSSECGVLGTCKCTSAWCSSQPGSNYCGGDGACHAKLTNGRACCGNGECQSSHCSASMCMFNFAGLVVSTGTCYSPGTVPIGGACANSDNCAVGFCAPDRRCRCDGHEDCPSSKHCNRVPTTGEPGLCLDRLGEWRDCLDANDCIFGAVCGAEFQPVTQCYLPGTRDYGQSCLADTHCSSGRCEPTCSWNWGDCNPVTFFQKLSQGDLGVFSRCGCTARCTCQSDSHCPGGQFCDSQQLFGFSFAQCSGKKGFGSSCSRDSMCSSGHCVTGTTGVKNCGCDNNGQCGLGRKCKTDSGRCVIG